MSEGLRINTIERELPKEISGEDLGSLVYYSYMYSQGQQAFQNVLLKYIAGALRQKISDKSIADLDVQLRENGSRTQSLFSRVLNRDHVRKERLIASEDGSLRDTAIEDIVGQAKDIMKRALEVPSTLPHPGNEITEHDNLKMLTSEFAEKSLERDAHFWFGGSKLGSGEEKESRKRRT